MLRLARITVVCLLLLTVPSIPAIAAEGDRPARGSWHADVNERCGKDRGAMADFCSFAKRQNRESRVLIAHIERRTKQLRRQVELINQLVATAEKVTADLTPIAGHP